jgi:hypothetical protein
LLDSESTITHFLYLGFKSPNRHCSTTGGRWLTPPRARNGAACRACPTWLDGRAELSVQAVWPSAQPCLTVLGSHRGCGAAGSFEQIFGRTEQLRRGDC